MISKALKFELDELGKHGIEFTVFVEPDYSLSGDNMESEIELRSKCQSFKTTIALIGPTTDEKIVASIRSFVRYCNGLPL